MISISRHVFVRFEEVRAVVAHCRPYRRFDFFKFHPRKGPSAPLTLARSYLISMWCVCACVCALAAGLTGNVRSCSIEFHRSAYRRRRQRRRPPPPYVRRRDVASYLKTATTYDTDVTEFPTRVNKHDTSTSSSEAGWTALDERGIVCSSARIFQTITGEVCVDVCVRPSSRR